LGIPEFCDQRTAVSNSIVRGLLFVGISLSVLSLPGCHGSPITITLSCPNCTGNSTANSAVAVTINQSDTLAITASVANDKTNSGVSWNLGSSVGSLSSQTTTSVTYVAPAALTQTTTATVTATSIANTNVTETVTITIQAVFQFQSTSLPIATVGIPYTGTISTIGATGPFSWTIISGSLPAGLTLANSNTASVQIAGTPKTVGTSTVTIQATNGSGTPISQSFTITVNPPPALTITTPSTIAPGTVNTFYTYPLQAANGTRPYTWSIVSGSLPPGLSLNDGTGVISGTPTTVATTTFYVQVTDSATPPATFPTNGRGFALTININEVFVNEDLSGNYAFLVSGFDSNGKSFTSAGSFYAADGSISGGIMDTNDGGTVQTGIGFSGSSSLGASGVGTITLVPIGRTFALSFVPSGGSPIQNANLIEFDNTGVQASGVLLEQTTSDFSGALTSGSFAFGFLGSDAAGLRYGLAGSFSGSTGVLDSDDGGTLQSDSAFTVSPPSTPDANGRGTTAFSVAGQAANYAYYVVNSQQVLVIEIDSTAIVSGSILLQSGTFGASSLTGGVFGTTAKPSGTALSQLGVVTTDGSGGHLSTSFNNNTSPTGAIQTSSGGTYTVDAITGRTTVTGSGLQASSDPVLYLVQPNQGFLVGTDTAVTFGFMKGQSPPLTTLSGIYAGGSIAPTLSGPSGEVDAASADGSGTLNLAYFASTSQGLLANQSLAVGYSSPSTNGRGTIPQSGNAPTDIFYVLSSTEYWDLSTVNAPGATAPGTTSGTIRIFQAACNPNCETQ
jgi:Putative Ig domain